MVNKEQTAKEIIEEIFTQAEDVLKGATKGKVAFVFSGQGAQYSGMGKSLYEHSAAAKNVFDTAESIRPGTKNQCFSGTLEEISITKNTQPCLFCVDLAAAEALREAGITPDMTPGFSLGEVGGGDVCGHLYNGRGLFRSSQSAAKRCRRQPSRQTAPWRRF